MNKVLRAQMSIIFDDVTMYNEFITPLKANKELGAFVLKLLTAYYYNDNVRALIDADISDSESAESSPGTNDYLEKVRNTFFVMNSFIDSAKGSIDEGIKNMQSFADSFSSSEDTHTDFGRPVLNLTVPSEIQPKAEPVSVNDNKDDSTKAELEDLKQDISELKNLVRALTSGGATMQASTVAEAVVEKPVVKVESKPIVNEVVEDEPEEVIDGTSILDSLVGSLKF